MIVSIKSEMDSRPVLYSLMSVLHAFGKICVISSNPIIQRLEEDKDSGGMRDVRIIYDADGAVDSVYEEHGIIADDYDFLLLDNMGAIEYDLLMVAVGETLSELFQEDINMLKREDNSRFIQFGKGDKSSSRSSSKQTRRFSSRRSRNIVDEELVDDPGPESRFSLEEDEEEEYKISERWYSSCEYPTWEEIEQMESKFRFPRVGKSLSGAYYDIFKVVFNVDKRNYTSRIESRDRSLTGNSKSRVID